MSEFIEMRRGLQSIRFSRAFKSEKSNLRVLDKFVRGIIYRDVTGIKN